MPSVLIAGCGYVGSKAAELFQRQGWTVTAWTRSGAGDVVAAITSVPVDLRDREDVRQNSFECDVVVHCASSRGGNAEDYRQVYRNGVANLAAAFPEARLIFTSSTSVYSQRDGGVVDESSPAEPLTPKGNVLRESENLVLEHGAGLVLRLGAIYGPGRWFLLRSLQEGTASIFGMPDRFVNHIHRDDAANAIVFLAGKAPCVSSIFNVVDNLPARRSEILTWLSAQTKLPLADSAPAFPRTLPRRGKRGDSNKRVSNAKLREQGWSPLYPSFREGFARGL